MKIIHIAPNSRTANTYALVSGNHAAVIDPAVSVDAIMSAIKAEGAVLDKIILTHGHFDHIASLDTLRDATGVRAFICEEDAEMLTDGYKNAFSVFFGMEKLYRPADKFLSNGQIIPLGDEEIKVIRTAGHSKGSICLLCPDFLVTGDTLFANSVGRCDLWGGNSAELAKSLAALRELDSSLIIYPGHGTPERLGRALDNAAYYF